MTGTPTAGLLLDPVRAARVSLLVADAVTKLRAARLAEAEALSALLTLRVALAALRRPRVLRLPAHRRALAPGAGARGVLTT